MIKGYDVKAVMVAGRAGLIRRAWAVPARRKLMLVEALCRVCAAWLMIRAVPFRYWRSRLGVPDGGRCGENALGGEQMQSIHDVTWAHSSLQRLFGTGFTCLMLAISARDMLARRGIETILILGVDRSFKDGRRGRFGAHAWVKCGDRFIVGQAGSDHFTPVAVYRSEIT